MCILVHCSDLGSFRPYVRTISFTTHCLEKKNVLVYLCTDINLHACRASERTGNQNKVSCSSLFQKWIVALKSNWDKVPLDCMNASFASPLIYRLRRQIDVILFNPPYVPTGHKEALWAQEAKNITGAWAGGVDGMQVTNDFLEIVQVRNANHRENKITTYVKTRNYCLKKDASILSLSSKTTFPRFRNVCDMSMAWRVRCATSPLHDRPLSQHEK